MITSCYKTDKYVNCKYEQDFKMRFIKETFKPVRYRKVFCIETEETIAGFPDVMMLTCSNCGNKAEFFEFKFSNSKGVIKFQPTQPPFYRKNPEMGVIVVAYNQKTKVLHIFPASDIFDKNSRYAMNPRAEINLCKVEAW